MNSSISALCIFPSITNTFPNLFVSKRAMSWYSLFPLCSILLRAKDHLRSTSISSSNQDPSVKSLLMTSMGAAIISSFGWSTQWSLLGKGVLVQWSKSTLPSLPIALKGY
nr:hypothetical protein Iba_chr10eCG14320 [Ipomoea batatas]